MDPATAESLAPNDAPTVLPTVGEHIGVRPGYCGGEPHILGHRIKVRHVAVWHERMGMTPTEIVVRHPSISLAQVHAALAYYYDHRGEIDSAIEAEDRFVEELMSANPPSKLRLLLESRSASWPDDSVSSR